MEKQDIKLPEPIRVKNIHQKLDIFAENNDIKDWNGSEIIDTFFYLYLFNKYKQNCFIRYNKLKKNTAYYFLGLKLIIKEKKETTIEETSNYDIHMLEIAKQLADCIKRQELQNIVLPLYLKFGDGGHANLLIYRQKNNVIEHFEPHGSQLRMPAKKIKAINKKLDEFISILNKELPQQSKVQLVRANDVCPMFNGFQALEEKSTVPKLEIQGGGYCAAWSMFFTELALKNPNYSSNELINIIYDKLEQYSIKDRNNYLRKVIVGYVNLISDKIDKYFSIIFGRHISPASIKKILKEKRDIDFMTNMSAILEIENAFLNDPTQTKEDYLDYLQIKIKTTTDNSEKNKLIKQEQILNNIDELLNPSPITGQSKSPSKKSSSSLKDNKSKSPSNKSSSSLKDNKSKSPSNKPNSPSNKPESPSNNPLSPSNKPLSPFNKPESPSNKPESPFNKPEYPFNKPESPSNKPLSPSKKSSVNEEKSRCDEKKLKPCSNTQIRNPKTCRCNKIKVDNTRKRKITGDNTRKRKICEPEKLSPCTNDKVRNPITCRCNKIKVDNTRKRKICEPEKLGPCKINQERNPKTCRCNKIKV